jgi:uncharacterized membrane protein
MPASVFAIIVQNGSRWGALLSQFLVLAFLIGIPALVVWGMRATRRGPGGRSAPLPDPEEILKVRLARGEIDAAEYEHLRGLIRADR